MRTIIALTCLVLATPVAVADQHTTIGVDVLAKTSSSWNGSSLPGYPGGTPEVTVLRITISPGATVPMHRHPVINAGVLLEGELTVIAESGDTLRLEAGEAIVELVDQWHHGRNDGDGDAVIVVFYAGIAGRPITEAR